MENIINTNLVTLDLLKRGGGGTVTSLAAGKAGAWRAFSTSGATMSSGFLPFVFGGTAFSWNWSHIKIK